MNARRLFFVLSLLLLCHALSAQIRVEPSVGASFPLNGASGTRLPFPSVVCGVKYYPSSRPFSFGVEGAMNIAYRREGATRENGVAEDWALRNLSLLAVVDWHFYTNQNIRLFLGCGAGLAHRHQTLPGFNTYDAPALGICCSPRVGIYLKNRLFFALNAYVTEKNFNTIGLQIGYSIGKKK